MKTLISSALLFFILAAALWPVPEAEAITEPKCSNDGDFCIEMHSPLCGTDGETYENECKLCVANRQNGKSVKIKHQGKC